MRDTFEVKGFLLASPSSPCFIARGCGAFESDLRPDAGACELETGLSRVQSEDAVAAAAAAADAAATAAAAADAATTAADADADAEDDMRGMLLST